MDRKGRSLLDSFQRVKEFLSQHPLSVERQSLGVQAAELDDVIQRLSSEAVEQESRTRYTRVHTEYERTLRATLYADHIQPISQIARDVFGLSDGQSVSAAAEQQRQSAVDRYRARDGGSG